MVTHLAPLLVYVRSHFDLLEFAVTERANSQAVLRTADGGGQPGVIKSLRAYRWPFGRAFPRQTVRDEASTFGSHHLQPASLLSRDAYWWRALRNLHEPAS